jgi:uncharacterized spore protein YtfJ
MAQNDEALLERVSKGQDIIRNLHDRLGAVAHHDAVFGTPIQHGDTTVIPFGEVTTAMGFGFGMGEDAAKKALGGGGGGGGIATGHPVGVIIVDADGVRIKPVLDYTKLGLGILAAIGGAMVLMRAMQRTKRKQQTRGIGA